MLWSIGAGFYNTLLVRVLSFCALFATTDQVHPIPAPGGGCCEGLLIEVVVRHTRACDIPPTRSLSSVPEDVAELLSL